MSRNLRIEELILGVRVVFAFVGGSTFSKKKLKEACGGNDGWALSFVSFRFLPFPLFPHILPIEFFLPNAYLPCYCENHWRRLYPRGAGRARRILWNA